MKVGELIEELKNFDPDLEVVLFNNLSEDEGFYKLEFSQIDPDLGWWDEMDQEFISASCYDERRWEMESTANAICLP